ncbi:hypothetical protein Tco_1365501 [Tanacetum coccineum]
MKTITDQGNPTSNPHVPPFERDQVEADLTGDDKKHFEADIDAMNVILLGILNDIYNSIDACKTAQDLCQRVQRLIQGTDLSKQELTLRLLHEFDKFKGMHAESTKNPHEVDYDQLYDYLKQNENNVNASRAKRAVRTHDLLALITNHYFVPSSSAYYVTSPPSVNDFDVETRSYEFQGDAIYVHDCRVNVQSKNVGKAGRNTGRIAGNSGNATLVNKLMETIRLCKELQG